MPDSIDRLLSQIYPLASIIQHGCRPTTEPSTQEYAVFLATPELDFPVRVVCLLSTDGKSVSGWDEMAGDRLLMRWHGGMQVPPMLLGKLVSLGFSPPEQVAPGLWMALHPQPHLWLVPDALEAVQGLPALAYAEPDGIVRVHHLPDDPAFVEGALWNLLNDGREGGIDGFDVAALAGWAITTDARHAPIAIVDSGIRYTHRDLAANMWVNPGEIRDGRDSDNNLYVDDIHGINRVTSLPSRRGDPADDFGHGTHVAGIAAAVGGNRLDGVGVAWSARLMALKSLSAAGTGTVSGSVACLDYARTHGAAVINLSWGRDAFSQALFDAVAACRESGIPVVAAAGNNGRNLDLSPHYPASFELDNVIVVGAFDRRGQWLRESNFGSGTVHLAAPGLDVLSTWNSSDSSHQLGSGTSMAAPHVSAALALIASLDPDGGYLEWIDALKAGTFAVQAWGDKVQWGGKLDLGAALADANRRSQERRQVRLTLSSEPASGGTTSGSGSVPRGGWASLLADPHPGYQFNGWWSGQDLVSRDPIHWFGPINEDTHLSARFVPLSLVAAVCDPPESGTVSGTGAFPEGELVTLEVSTSPGFRFLRWEGENAPPPFDPLNPNPQFSSGGPLSLRALHATEVSLSLPPTTLTFSGVPTPVEVPSPGEWGAVLVTYDGRPDPPVSAGLYSVVAQVQDERFYGWAESTLTILPAPALVIPDFSPRTFSGPTERIEVVTVPFGLPVQILYHGLLTEPSQPGRYPIEVTVVHPDYVGRASGSWVLSQVTLSLTPHVVPWYSDLALLEIDVVPADAPWELSVHAPWARIGDPVSSPNGHTFTVPVHLQPNRTIGDREAVFTCAGERISLTQLARIIPSPFVSLQILGDNHPPVAPGWSLTSVGTFFEDLWPFVYYHEGRSWLHLVNHEAGGFFLWPVPLGAWVWSTLDWFPWVVSISEGPDFFSLYLGDLGD